ncbi:MAG: DUF433 domain-containing protein [Blastocatellia bacterium]
MVFPKVKTAQQPSFDEEVKQLRQLAQTAPPITSNPERMSGAPVIALSRVPVAAILDVIAEGGNLDDFLRGFPSISRQEAIAALDRLKEALEEGAIAEASLTSQ